MLHMCSYSATESLFGTLHEVISSTAMHVYVNTARHYIHTFCINYFCAYNCEVAIGYR